MDLGMLTKELDFLNFKPRPTTDEWVPCEVVFIGGGDYVLCSVSTEAKVEIVRGGFKTKFKKPFAVPAETLLGKKIKQAKIWNIELVMPCFTLDMRTMYPDTFPRTITVGDVVGINELRSR